MKGQSYVDKLIKSSERASITLKGGAGPLIIYSLCSIT